MPLYEYECGACGSRFERIQKFSDALLTTCPSCGGEVQKLFSSPAIQFKGTGWYITDYARKPSGDQTASSEDSERSSKSSTSAKDKKEATKGSKRKTGGTESSPKPSESSSSSK